MRARPITAALLSLLSPLVAQEKGAGWDVEFPVPAVAKDPATPVQEPEPVQLEVLTSRTKRVFVQESPEMSDLPPVTGTINLTIQKVADPGLPDPPPPLPPLPPTDPAVLARLQELRKTYRARDLVFVSASVYMEAKDSKECRTLLTIYPNGQAGKEVVAWSNLNFLHLTGQGAYRVNFEDGTYQDVGLLMGVSPIYGDVRRRMAARAGRDFVEPEPPKMPDLATAGPSFVVVEGDADSPAMDTLEQLHDLFGKAADTLKEQYLAREKAYAERKAYLLANPPKPSDVTMWITPPRRSDPPAENTASKQ